MDDKSVELLKHSSAAYAAEISPMYAQAREQLLANLALSNLDIGSRRGEHERGVDNAAMIRMFMDFLPKAQIRGLEEDEKMKPYERKASYFAGTAFDQIIMMQAATFFYKRSQDVDSKKSYPLYAKEPQAFFVIGVDGSTQEVLAYKLKHDEGGEEIDGQIAVFTPYARERYMQSAPPTKRKSMLKMSGDRIDAEYSRVIDDIEGYRRLNLTPSEAEAWSDEIYDAASGNFVIDADTPGSKILTSFDKLKSPWAFSGDITVGFDMRPQAYISDADMMKYNVPDHLLRLATMFAKNDEFNSTLQIRQTPEISE